MDVTVRDLTKSYGGAPVLENFSHTFPAGETTVIMGPSGGGKTTLLRLILGLETPDSGEVLLPPGTRFSAIFQEDRLCENVSAAANLRLVRPDLSRREAEKVLLDLGLEDARQPVREYSGGMKRRVAILRALLAPYDVLVADEPFKGLDEATRERVMTFFREQTRNRTVLLVTHEEAEAAWFGGPLLTIG